MCASPFGAQADGPSRRLDQALRNMRLTEAPREADPARDRCRRLPPVSVVTIEVFESPHKTYRPEDGMDLTKGPKIGPSSKIPSITAASLGFSAIRPGAERSGR